MKLVFYFGGRRAHAGDYYWMGRGGMRGCDIVDKVGAVIPTRTYWHADPKVSQDNYGSGIGHNYTAILPLEV